MAFYKHGVVVLTGVFLAVDKDDWEMRAVFPQALRRTAPELLVCELGRMPPTSLRHALVVFKSIPKRTCPYPAGEQTVAVVDSGGRDGLLEQVSQTMLPAITCGLSVKDTLTLSSIRADGVVVTLQRSLHCFDGSVAEPQEIPIRIRAPVDNFTLLSTAAVLILTGRVERLGHAAWSFSAPESAAGRDNNSQS